MELRIYDRKILTFDARFSMHIGTRYVVFRSRFKTWHVESELKLTHTFVSTDIYIPLN
jgi:hypothetical protein